MGRWYVNRLFSSMALLAGVALGAAPAKAEVALLMEEPFGQFGAFNPTGHAAVYLSNICAETPTRLRRCEPGEYGSVISRYHKVDGRDWIVMPLVAYLYAVEDAKDVPEKVNRADVTAARVAYWRAHLTGLAPAKEDGSAPGGEWDQLVGSSFDRKIHGFGFDSTEEQDDRFIAIYNDKRNVGHFNLFFHNCADFSRGVMDFYFPGSVERKVFPDMGMTTPKQSAHSLLKYGEKHPELHPITFEISQVPGTVPRSHRVDGIAESLVRSKKYVVPLAFFQPHVAAALAVDYIVTGRNSLPKAASSFALEDWKIPAPTVLPVPAMTAKPVMTSTPAVSASAVGFSISGE